MYENDQIKNENENDYNMLLMKKNDNKRRRIIPTKLNTQKPLRKILPTKVKRRILPKTVTTQNDDDDDDNQCDVEENIQDNIIMETSSNFGDSISSNFQFGKLDDNSTPLDININALIRHENKNKGISRRKIKNPIKTKVIFSKKINYTKHITTNYKKKKKKNKFNNTIQNNNNNKIQLKLFCNNNSLSKISLISPKKLNNTEKQSKINHINESPSKNINISKLTSPKLLNKKITQYFKKKKS